MGQNLAHGFPRQGLNKGKKSCHRCVLGKCKSKITGLSKCLLSSWLKNSVAAEKNLRPTDLLQSHHQICTGLHRRAAGQRRALIVALQQKLLPLRALGGPPQRKERSHRSAAVLHAEQTKTEARLCSQRSSVVQSLARSSLAGSSARSILVCRLLQRNNIF